MKNYFLKFIFLFILFFSTALPAQEYMKKKNGEYKLKYSNGHIQTIGKIENHLKTGEWKNYTFDGQLKSVYTYKNGVMNGPFTLYYANGNKANEGNFTNGVLTGEWKSWHMNGKQQAVHHYNSDGKETGLQQSWTDKGIPTDYRFYGDNGYEQWMIYSQSGQVNAKLSTRNRKKEGVQYYYRTTFTMDTFPEKIETYHNDRLEGPTKKYGKNHMLIEEIYFKNDTLDSVARAWDQNGKLNYELHYKAGVLNGYCAYYLNGEKTNEGYYVNGKVHGLYMNYMPELCYNWYTNNQMDSCKCYHKNKKMSFQFITINAKENTLKGIQYDTLGRKFKDWISKSGVKHGPTHTYHTNGKVKSAFGFHILVPEGILKTWNPQGKLVMNAPLNDGNSDKVEAWSDAGVKLKKGTAAFNAQVKKYLPEEFRLDETTGNIYSNYEKELQEDVRQEDPPEEIADDDVVTVHTEEIFSFAEEMPSFPDFNQYLKDNLKYPEDEKSQLKQGTVYVSFIVEKDGSVTNVTIAKGVRDASGFDTEAMRVIAGMPKWKPGMMNGRAVRVHMTQPVRFAL